MPKGVYSRGDPVARFWSHVDKSGGPDACWNWKAGLSADGYGQVQWGWRPRLAHRIAFILSGGILTTEKPLVLHRCKQSRACCNPAHLYAGDHVDNAADRDKDATTATGGRHGAHTRPESLARGEANGRAKLTAIDVAEIRAAWRGGESQCSLGRHYSVSQLTIGRIVRMETWKEEAAAINPAWRPEERGGGGGLTTAHTAPERPSPVATIP